MSFDFAGLQKSNVEWPKRGRKAKELPEDLLEALRSSAQYDTPLNMVLNSDEVGRFASLLSKCGGQLNLRIERLLQPDTPAPGKTTYHFWAKGKRNREL